MPPIPFADNFLAGSLLSLLLPIGLLIALAIWYVLAVRRVPEDTPASSAVAARRRGRRPQRRPHGDRRPPRAGRRRRAA